jgi:hypothetical protein
MDPQPFLARVLMLFGVGFLIANLRLAADLVRYLRRRRSALLVWPGRRPKYYGLILTLGVTLGFLLVLKIVMLQRVPTHAPEDDAVRVLFGEGMMFVYFACMVPLTRLIDRGLYADGIWAENGFVPYQQIGGIAWREGEPLTLVLVSRIRQIARPLIVPSPYYGAVRRLLRDKIAAEAIDFKTGGLDLGRDGKEDV